MDRHKTFIEALVGAAGIAALILFALVVLP